MYCHLYLRNGIVYIPTMGKMDTGFYRDIEPVAVIRASDTEALRQALAAMIDRENPMVPMLPRREWSAPVVLKYAGVRSWSAFEKGMSLWGLDDDKNGQFALIGKRKQANGATVDDPGKTIIFSAELKTEDVIEKIIKVLQGAVRQMQTS